eukprot:TRINITY_DN1682_c1_g1_i5.p1 TRINITY_DN1682_c1_g1~~TRINITY_DN1682_c1_g1_i5.p1  ORF type:complete len:729 (+),score=352.30 TRINITY_DN1682_c1_g1_i5:150-2189(+)
MTTPTPASKTEGMHLEGMDDTLLDSAELQKFSTHIDEGDLLEAQSRDLFGDSLHGPRNMHASMPSHTSEGYRGSSLPATSAEEAEILQSKAEAIVAALDDSQVLKQKNPFGGLSFQDLIHKISLDPNLKVYNKKVPAEKLVQGTVAEQLISVVDCEKERYLHKTRTLIEDYEHRIATMQADHETDMRRLKDECIKDRMEMEQECDTKLDRSKQNMKGHAELLAREGLQNQLESERTKDELALVNEDVAALKKLLFFWKKKNNVLKKQFDDNERELVLAREKLKDYYQIHEMDAYKVHRFCGQLREKEMKSRWRAEELQKRVVELMVEIQHLKEGKAYIAGTGSDLDHELSRMDIDAPQLVQDEEALHVASPQREKVDPNDAAAFDEIRSEVNKSRFELSARCRLLLGMDRTYDNHNKVTTRLASCFTKDQQTVSAEMTALNDGIRLRDDQIDVLLSALRYRDQTVEQMRADLDGATATIHNIRMRQFEPFHCEDIVKENDSLQRQLNDCKDIMYNMQKQVQAERQDMAEERKVRADRELAEAKERKEKEIAMSEKLRDKDTEIIRLRNRLQEGPSGDDSATEVRILRLEQAKTELQEAVASHEEEKVRLKQYVASLGSRLEQTLSQLSHRNQKLQQYEAITANLTLSPRMQDTSPSKRDTSSPALPAPMLSPIPLSRGM